MQRAIVIVDHGSRLEAANAVALELARLVQARAGAEVIVRASHMEIAEPSLPSAIAECVAAGAREVTVVPLFLVPGRHATHDIPHLLAEARAKHPGVSFELGDVIGADPLLAELICRRAEL